VSPLYSAIGGQPAAKGCKEDNRVELARRHRLMEVEVCLPFRNLGIEVSQSPNLARFQLRHRDPPGPRGRAGHEHGLSINIRVGRCGLKRVSHRLQCAQDHAAMLRHGLVEGRICSAGAMSENAAIKKALCGGRAD